MSWKKLQNHKVPGWVRRKKRAHVAGKTYLYRKRGKIWQRRLKDQWLDDIAGWKFILVGFISTLAAAIISGIVLYYFFG